MTIYHNNNIALGGGGGGGGGQPHFLPMLPKMEKAGWQKMKDIGNDINKQ